MCAVWAALSVAWIAADKLIRDGDEEGHVGAAELFLGDLRHGDLLGFLERLWVGPMGEYPQAFAASVGSWWWLTGTSNPGDVSVRAICLMSLLLTALATGKIARRYVHPGQARSAELVAVSATLLIPLGNGLSRHFMPEGALMAAVAVTLLSAHRLTERPSMSRGLQLGVILGLGLLTKQTFPLLIAAPMIYIIGRPRRTLWIPLSLAALTAACLAGPWLLSNAANQLTYTTAAVEGHGTGGLLAHLLFYPESILRLGLGPPLFIAAVASAFTLIRARDRRPLMLAVVWLLGGLLILCFIPKKYPRLAAPLLPAAAVLVAAAWVRGARRQRTMLLGVSLAVPWVFWTSTQAELSHPRATAIDPGCPQVWLRPPSADDLGLAEVQKKLSTLPPGAVLVDKDQSIPCSLQTTHNWSSHLGPYLRRSGTDRDVHTDSASPHRFVLSLGAEGGEISLPGLQMTLSIHDTLQP